MQGGRRCWLEECGCGARTGKISQTHAGAWQGGFKFCRCESGQKISTRAGSSTQYTSMDLISLILGTRVSIIGTLIGTLEHPKKL